MANVYSVSQVNSYIRNMFAQDYALSRISVTGEVSNLKYHSSGHIYFTLKDSGGAIACVMFAGKRAQGLLFRMEEGQKVIASGSIEVYAKSGQYQLYANKIIRDGQGDLFQKFEQLKKQLEEMGMFAPEYKKPIPKYAKTVGVVTAETGAAIHDIMNIASRRNPYVQLILCPAKVQGEGAAESIVRAIGILDGLGTDVMIVGRGGGSIEDLWAFNEEIVARAVFSCRTPVISAVGHETDWTIADFVADLRAPTPSAAAELAVFDYALFERSLAETRQKLRRLSDRKTDEMRKMQEYFRLKLLSHSPERELKTRRQALADISDRMELLMSGHIRESRRDLELSRERMTCRMDGDFRDSGIGSEVTSVREEQTNIILIGMPGCGKTTIASILGRMTGRQVIETDDLVEQDAGCSISEIFAAEGEDGFRKRETQAVIRACGSSGAVIATGGGTVTRAENYLPLHRSGIIYQLQRDTGLLAREGRPLSLAADLDEMYHARRHMYLAFRDRTADNNGTPEDAAVQIWEDFVETANRFRF